MKIRNLNICSLLLSFSFILIFVSCKEEAEIRAKDSKDLKFLGYIEQGENLTTRSTVTVQNITFADFPIPIYIRMDVGNKSLQGTYQVKPGYDGRLSSIDETNDLNWLDSDSGHTFYGWTMPWKENDDNILSDEQEIVSFSPEYYRNLGLPESEYNNCALLEEFIGTKAGPVNYRANGEYVEMQFTHLVSKIFISGMNLITNDGSTWQNVSGEMTFFNFPNKGYFYRHPENGEAPMVQLPEPGYIDDYSDVTYNVTRGSAFYICPEIDLSEVEFKIKLTWPTQQGIEGEYYGDFSNIEIKRLNNDEWDSQHKDTKYTKTLYASEVLNLNLTLRQGNITGVSATINNWSTKNVDESENYPRKGIYDNGQFADLLNGENFDDLYNLYGGEPDDEEKVFHVYEDLEINADSLEIPDGFILDGMGHTVLKVAEGQTISVKNVRDVYITDGTNTIFIDYEGNIYTVNPETGAMTPKGTLKTNTSTTINLQTGAVS